MYLQVQVRPEDRKYQRILWRDEQGQINNELNTVTFGLSASPFLAIRSLHQLAMDEAEQFPLAADILRRDLYVDDLLTGALTLEEATRLRDESIALLHRGKFNLRQCASNSIDLLCGLTDQSINLQLQSGDDKTLKTLVAKIFDPLGLLQPVIVTAKLIMQQLWKLELAWDETLPANIHTEWVDFSSHLSELHNLTFRRKIVSSNSEKIQLHGFCDASEKAYGACRYLRSTNSSGEVYSQLVCTKSRVAPMKRVQTIPRLELCAAKLLTTLHKTVMEALNVQIDRSIFWTDSTIVQHWINTSPHKLKTFVANRIVEIRQATNPDDWRHVRSHENPADQLSRGQSPEEFLRNDLWRTGPSWLKEEESTWPNFKIQIPTLDEKMRKDLCFTVAVNNHEILERYSSIGKLRRILSYCLRMKKDNQFKGIPTVQEIRQTNQRIIKLVQSSSFMQEIHDLQNGKPLNSKSRLLSLSPFLDEAGILRVGGRLRHADISHNQRHPILLPKSNHITNLIIENDHQSHGHAGV
nr:uncharacterized protein LOC124211294 [Neodiprion pinetum]